MLIKNKNIIGLMSVSQIRALPGGHKGYRGRDGDNDREAAHVGT